ncbi:MAG TPA: MmcQ/YjbR family DNA-binding protein [Caulobacteraceae bacterium]|nr:MmcQ/YjbR family DNA-binding protein [Caulobacteraceae bacterium]
MATLDDIRAVALALPGAGEVLYHGEPWFTVGSKGFVQAWRGRVVMKLEKHHQELLFEARPEVFSPMIAGALRWSWVEIGALDGDEIADLVREAWTQVVPKRVSRAHFGDGGAASRPPSPSAPPAARRRPSGPCGGRRRGR